VLLGHVNCAFHGARDVKEDRPFAKVAVSALLRLRVDGLLLTGEVASAWQVKLRFVCYSGRESVECVVEGARDSFEFQSSMLLVLLLL